jgi:hypothetical protein
MTTQRERFEAWAAKPPREFDLDRFDDGGAWPGNYVAYNVECAWQAWQEAERHMIERAAVLCDELDQEGNCDDYRQSARWCAERIRSMGCADIRALGADDDPTP